MIAKISDVIKSMDFDSIHDERKSELQSLVDFIQNKRNLEQPVLLNFICTHNSRRSQFSQLWAQVASDYYKIPAECFSGGVEVTEFNINAIQSLERFGFKIEQNGSSNPKYMVSWNEQVDSLSMFSKLFDDSINPDANFAAIMTCSHADENCPFVPGCEKRIAIRYEDPKKYDETPLAATFYDYRSFEIATELFYVFSKIK